jgi:Type I phosphodiesterase / nucleotide pyrophosphatase
MIRPVSVDDLRSQLRERGYLSHGIERWFALDPWSSRAFWLELTTVAAKSSLLIALFAVLPVGTVMLFRNHPLAAGETMLLTVLYGAAAFAVLFGLFVAIALILRLRPSLAIDTPRALLGISFVASALPAAAIAYWWYRFDAPPSWPELLLGLALMTGFFLFASLAVSAALLSFSIYELRRIPAIHQRSRAVPMTLAATILIAALFLPAYASQEKHPEDAPIQVVTTPTTGQLALIAVDGLTFDILRARPDLARALPVTHAVATLPGHSTTERWASLGTGVITSLHGVHAVEGVRLRGGGHLLQSISHADVVLLDLAERIGLARREALPPTVRRRHFIWEILAERGVPSVAVNWWTADDTRTGGLESIGQTSIFAAAAAGRDAPDAVALHVDETATLRFVHALDSGHPRFATVYLPALDVVLNRLPLDASTKLTASVHALDGVNTIVAAVRARGYDVLLAGMPGDNQGGQAVVAATFPLVSTTTPFDVAPTLLSRMGFPPSVEMPGRALAGSETPRIATYGPRAVKSQSTRVNEEYYESLRSLGYIR